MNIIEYLNNKFSSGKIASFVPKYTTRKHRPEEISRNLQLDLVFISLTEFNKHKQTPNFYSY